MKSRDLQSSFFTDPYIQYLKLEHKWIYLYYLFNKCVNWLGCYEITDKTVLFELDGGLKLKDLEAAKEIFQKDEKLLFIDNYVIIKNSEKYEKFMSNKQLMRTALLQFKELPDKIKSAFLSFKPSTVVDAYRDMFLNLNYEIDGRLFVGYSVDYKVGYRVAEVISNKKEVIRNNTEEKKIKIKEKNDEIILKTWNEVFGTKYKATNGFSGNLQFWLQSYELDEILRAIKYAKKHSFWGDKITPMTFFRQRNPKGEGVDYIGEMLNTVQEKHKDDAELDPLVLTSLKIYEQKHGR